VPLTPRQATMGRNNFLGVCCSNSGCSGLKPVLPVLRNHVAGPLLLNATFRVPLGVNESGKGEEYVSDLSFLSRASDGESDEDLSVQTGMTAAGACRCKPYPNRRTEPPAAVTECQLFCNVQTTVVEVLSEHFAGNKRAVR
jgi:hypothetical protein